MGVEGRPWAVDDGGGKRGPRARRLSKDDSPGTRLSAVEVSSIELDDQADPATPPHSRGCREGGKQADSTGGDIWRNQSPRLEVCLM